MCPVDDGKSLRLIWQPSQVLVRGNLAVNGQWSPRRWRFTALPVLKGWSFWVFAAVWTTTLVVGVLANAMVAPNLIQQATAPAPATAAIGLLISPDWEWPTVGVPIGPEAVSSNLRRGDRLIAIDGRPVAATSNGLNAQIAGPVGTHVTVTTQTPSGRRVDHVLTRNPENYRQALTSIGLNMPLFRLRTVIAWLIDNCLFLGCAVLLMTRRSRDPLAPWASLMMLLMMFAFGDAQEWFASLFPHPRLAGHFVNATAFSLLAIVLTVFPTGRFEPRWSLAVAILGTVVTFASVASNFVWSNAVAVLVYTAAVAATAARYRNMPPGTGRQQIRWALFGFAGSVAAIAVLVALQIAQASADNYGRFAWLSFGSFIAGILIFALLMLGITISLMRYRLYDADATISRAVAYSMLTVSLLALFAGCEKLIEILGEEYLGEKLGALSGAIAAAAAAVMIVPFHHRVTHWAEHRFRSALAHLRHGLPLLVGDLRETAPARQLAEATLLRIERGVRATRGAILVNGAVLDKRNVSDEDVSSWFAQERLPTETHCALQCDRRDSLFPVRVPLAADGVVDRGWLLLGPRPDGSLFGREERAALREIADPVARALAVALERERREASQQHREAELIDGIRSLHKRVEALRAFVLERFGFDVDAATDADAPPGFVAH